MNKKDELEVWKRAKEAAEKQLERSREEIVLNEGLVEFAKAKLKQLPNKEVKG